MRLHVYPSNSNWQGGRPRGRRSDRDAVAARGKARIIAATGASQFEFLDALDAVPICRWRASRCSTSTNTSASRTHPASFRKYLKERLIDKTGMTRVHLLDGEQDAEHVCDEAGRAIAAAPIDVAFVGIGENAHLAFNDPPADFETEVPYLIVTLDEPCRQQQVGEGWFASMADVPKRAISMSVRRS